MHDIQRRGGSRTAPPTPRRRKNIRLPEYDYSSDGYYSVTLVETHRDCLFVDPRYADIVDDTWLWLEHQYSYVELDHYVVMPNHFHGILILRRDVDQGRSRTTPTLGVRKALGRLIGAFKTVSTRRINELRGTPGASVWQRNYYERVIRDQRELNAIRQYIIDNPLKWAEDPENPKRVQTSRVVRAVREQPVPEARA